MQNSEGLFGKTFDQQVDIAGQKVTQLDISPNRHIPAEVIFEPLMGGVRVTARDDKHRVLWGFIGSLGMMNQIHTPIAVYERLRDLLNEELTKHHLPIPAQENPVRNAKDAIKALRDTLDNLEESITVKKVTPATLDRARAIFSAVIDAHRQVCLEVAPGAGIGARGQQDE